MVTADKCFERRIFLKHFNETASALLDGGIDISKISPSQVIFGDSELSGAVTCMEPDIEKQKLKPLDRFEVYKDRDLFAYDESIRKYSALEGDVYFTCHSLVKVGVNDYLNRNLITLHFITSAKEIKKLNPIVILSKEPSIDYTKICALDKLEFLKENIQEHSMIFIDGPLIGSQVSEYNCKLNDILISKDVIPVFFVKNSMSRMVIESSSALFGRYNSDLHWAHKLLSRGERSPFFKYVDVNNLRFNKIFCYVKGIENFPQRVEIHGSIYNKYVNEISDIMEIVYYMLVAHGNYSNPQIRPIAIAEMYARDMLKYINISDRLDEFRLTPSINQQRFG